MYVTIYEVCDANNYSDPTTDESTIFATYSSNQNDDELKCLPAVTAELI
jgi:hypothetical protein